MGPLPWAPRSLLVVIRGVCEGKLEAVGLGQQQADILVVPAGSRQVLEKEQQLLKERKRVREGPGLQARSQQQAPGRTQSGAEESTGQRPQLLCPSHSLILQPHPVRLCPL